MTRRAGYTLLEVLLAAAIGVLVLAALYVALEMQLRQTQVGREVVEEAVLVRSLLGRMSQDIAASLQPPPKSNSGDPVTALLMQTGAAPAGQFNLGLQGSYDRLVLQVSRVPRPPRPQEDRREILPAPEGDLRLISYWLTTGGLAREEVRLGADSLADEVDELALVVAPEVRNVQFRYFDGTAWQESWDGTSLDASGAPQGPPLAVEIILEVGPAGAEMVVDPDTGGGRGWRRYRHVVALPTSSLPVGQGTTMP